MTTRTYVGLRGVNVHGRRAKFATMLGHSLRKLTPIIVHHSKILRPSYGYTDVCLFLSNAGMAYTYPFYYPMWFSRNDDVWIGCKAVDMGWQGV